MATMDIYSICCGEVVMVLDLTTANSSHVCKEDRE